MSEGSHGQIFVILDRENQVQLALKLQEDSRMATDEVVTLNKITDTFVKNKIRELKGEISYEATPRVINYGLFTLRNFVKHEKEIKVSYFTMPLYDMNLEEYLS